MSDGQARIERIEGWIFAGRHEGGTDWEHAVCGIVTTTKQMDAPEFCAGCGLHSRPYVPRLPDDTF